LHTPTTVNPVGCRGRALLAVVKRSGRLCGDDKSLTPLERPERFADREFLTGEEPI
jgi:hypothetical protein